MAHFLHFSLSLLFVFSLFALFPLPSSSSDSPPHPKESTLHQHILNLTRHLDMTASLSLPKSLQDYPFSMPKPSTSSYIQDVPPKCEKDVLKCSKEEWEKYMPLPLKRDLEPWLKSGFNSSDFVQNCTMPATAVVGYIYDGHVWYVNSGKVDNVKYRKFWKNMNYIATYLAEKYNKKKKLPVIRFALSVSSVASLEYDETCNFTETQPPPPLRNPYMVLAKNREDPSPRVRMPTPYFTPDWSSGARKLYNNRTPWEEKNNTGCWIGAVNTMPGGLPRLMLLAESAKLSDENEDFRKFFEGVHPMTNPLKRFADWRRMGYFDNATLDLIGKPKTIAKQETDWFGGCKYNFHLPGHTRGGYSRALQNLIPQGTAVIKYESPWDEFYYDWLVKGKHYIPYTTPTLRDTVAFYLKNDGEGKKVAEAGAQFFADHLSWDNVLRYWEWLLLSLLRLDKTAEEARIPATTCQCFLDERAFEGRCIFCSPEKQAARKERRRIKHERIEARKAAEEKIVQREREEREERERARRGE